MPRYNPTSDRRTGAAPVRKLWTDRTREEVFEETEDD